MKHALIRCGVMLLAAFTAGMTTALAVEPGAVAATSVMPSLFGIPIEFFLFVLTLLGVALFHGRTMEIALSAAIMIALYKILFSVFGTGTGVVGFVAHLGHEWVTLTNLFALLMGFALLSRHFEESHVPAALPRFLPNDWKGCFVLLVLVFVLSSFLDNIAAAIIGGTIAGTVFRGKVHIGYLAAIVAASNAGGAGSVIGDTTTTMMWIAGISPLEVLEAFVGSGLALVIFGIPAARQQHAYSPIMKNEVAANAIDWGRVFVVALILIAAILVNVVVNTRYSAQSDLFPFIGVAVWMALLISAPFRKPDWAALPNALKGSVFLLSLVLCASMMPVEHLPLASWQTALGLGFVSSVFDNIPLTALAIKQGGYDWGFLAYAVGFGGSMIWFGSSAGVALSNLYPEARSVGQWLRHGWYVPIAYVAGFALMLAVVGWHPRTVPKGSNASVVHQIATVPAMQK